MSQAFELLCPTGIPLAALNPDPQALEYLSGVNISVITPFTPYRIEHPHSALVRKVEGLSRQDALYTPAGRLTQKFTRPAEDTPWEQQGAFVRRSSQLGALSAFCQDMKAVALPDSLIPEGDHLWYWMQPSPFARLFCEWVEPSLMASLTQSGECKESLKALDALYLQEASLLGNHKALVTVMDEQLTRTMASNPLWRKHAAKAAAALRAVSPETTLVITCRDLSLEPAQLPFAAALVQIIEPITPENTADLGKNLRPWLENPPEDSLALLSPSQPSLYPELIRRLNWNT